MATDPTVYPITAAFERDFDPSTGEAIRTWLDQFRGKVTNRPELSYVFKIMAGNLGEYEGGHADGLEEMGVTVEQYAQVCEDILLTMLAVLPEDVMGIE